MLCEACRLRIPMNTHVFNDRSYAIQHKVNGKDFSCQAADWRKVVKRKPHSRRETDDDYTLM